MQHNSMYYVCIINARMRVPLLTHQLESEHKALWQHVTTRMNVCVVQYVKILLYACARYAYLSFSMINNVLWDNLVNWHFRYCIAVCVFECLWHSICEISLYVCARCAYFSISKIRLTMYHGDNNECIAEITSPVTHLKGT